MTKFKGSDDWEQYEEDAYQDTIQPKVKPKRKKKETTAIFFTKNAWTKLKEMNCEL